MAIAAYRRASHSFSLMDTGFVTDHLCPYMGRWVTLAILTGFSSHILLDMFVGRVQFFFPYELKIGVKMPYALYVVVDLITRIGLAAVALVFVWNTYLSEWFSWI
ncbi:hypothetical protein [Novibacillus thermophilus]|uniref:hypothetical protein n=1 Tax=Novibacillus thermophilus TaxID=1471761 RepID=UPI001472BC7F|nr:hypothetical protein [Novibacillus thermophilus]